jgi:hypothetical protein
LSLGGKHEKETLNCKNTRTKYGTYEQDFILKEHLYKLANDSKLRNYSALTS